MINFEKYKDKVLAFVHEYDVSPAIVNGRFSECIATKCVECKFFGGDDCSTMFIKWLYEDDEDDGELECCTSCVHRGTFVERGNMCEVCSRNYSDQFKLKSKKTRLSEFLKHYPDAEIHSNGLPTILPCRIDKTYLAKCNASECGMCERDYWLQEVEE